MSCGENGPPLCGCQISSLPPRITLCDTGATANSWTITSITNDAYEPGILNPGETAVVHVTLSAPVQAGKTNFVLMDSEAGSIASTNFNS